MHIHVVEAKCECACASSQLYSYLFSENHRFQQDIYISVHFLLMLVSVHNCYLIDDVVSDISDLFQICEGHVSMVISTLKYFLLLFLPQSVVRLHVLSSFSHTETNSFIFLTHYFIFLTSFHVWCQFSAFFSLCCFVHRVPLRNREGLIYMLM